MTIEYTVDNEKQKTDKQELTPNQILTHAGIDTQTHYLVELRDHEKISYKDKPNEPIRMHEHMKFISVSTAPTPVSDIHRG